MKYMLWLGLPLCVLGCASQPHPKPAAFDPASDRKELETLREQVNGLNDRLGHLESEIAAASAENELTAMTIESVQWPSGESARMFPPASNLLCRVEEWRGYGKMLRFTRTADPVFYLEAEGAPALSAHMITGGICGNEGKVRFVVLQLDAPLDPHGRYHLRARNENEGYRWSVPSDLVVTAQDVP